MIFWTTAKINNSNYKKAYNIKKNILAYYNMAKQTPSVIISEETIKTLSGGLRLTVLQSY